jgi:hypothetical protein
MFCGIKIENSTGRSSSNVPNREYTPGKSGRRRRRRRRPHSRDNRIQLG